MTVHVTPLHDRVLVRRLEEKEIAKGGIIIPDTAKEKPQEGPDQHGLYPGARAAQRNHQ